MSDKPTRDCVFPPIRCTAEELQKSKMNAAASPLNSFSAYARELIVSGGTIIQRDSIGDKALLMALSRLGNNTNQSTKALNQLALSADAVGNPKLAAEIREALADTTAINAEIGTLIEGLMQ